MVRRWPALSQWAPDMSVAVRWVAPWALVAATLEMMELLAEGAAALSRRPRGHPMTRTWSWTRVPSRGVTRLVVLAAAVGHRPGQLPLLLLLLVAVPTFEWAGWRMEAREIAAALTPLRPPFGGAERALAVAAVEVPVAAAGSSPLVHLGCCRQVRGRRRRLRGRHPAAALPHLIERRPAACPRRYDQGGPSAGCCRRRSGLPRAPRQGARTATSAVVSGLPQWAGRRLQLRRRRRTRLLPQPQPRRWWWRLRSLPAVVSAATAVSWLAILNGLSYPRW